MTQAGFHDQGGLKQVFDDLHSNPSLPSTSDVSGINVTIEVEPLTDETIRVATNLWFTWRAVAEAKYGHIRDW